APLTLFLHSTRLSPHRPTLFPYTTLFRSQGEDTRRDSHHDRRGLSRRGPALAVPVQRLRPRARPQGRRARHALRRQGLAHPVDRSEEHTSELQSRFDLVCRLLLEKKKKTK